MLPGDNYSGAEMSDDDTDWSSVEGREGKGRASLSFTCRGQIPSED